MNNFRAHTVLVTGTDAESVSGLDDLIRANRGYQVVSADPSAITGGREIAAVPDMAVLDVTQIGDDEVDLLNALKSRFGDIPIIVTSDGLSDDQMRRLFKLKIHDWLRKPFAADGLLNSLKTAARTSKTTGNKVHAFIGAAGGVGTSTIAVSVADIISDSLKKTDDTVALFDLDFSTGNCGYLVNMLNSFNLESAAAHPERIDVEFINQIQKRHESGFYIYSFKRPDLLTEINGYELVLRMLDAVNLQHEHTILDIPYYETEWKGEVLSAVNTCSIVSNLNLAAIKHTLDVVERVQAIRGKDFPIHVLFNKRSGGVFGQRIKKSKLDELFEETPYSYLPEDESTINESVDRGLLPSEVKSSTRFLKALRSHVKMMTESDES
jgi:pilus assembly protein CpaE